MSIALPARLLLAALLPLAVCTAARAESHAAVVLRIGLSPVHVDAMSGVAWRATMQECNDIWAREGVALDWSGESAGAHLVLPVVFDHREVRQHDPKHEDAFGVTLFVGRAQRIIVSIKRAREVVSRRRGFADSSDGTTLDIALGRLLGRVVAHEIGHALLLTTGHTADGMMRARVDTSSIRPLLPGQFALSAVDRQRIAVRFSNTLAPPPQLADARPAFTWTDVPPAPSRLRAPR
jgi:hypothetical protein